MPQPIKEFFFDVEVKDTLQIHTRPNGSQVKKRNPSPYIPTNKLVSVGFDDQYVFVHHKERSNDDLSALHDSIAAADVVIAFNAKFDISWLLECGFDLNNKIIYDPMIVEYIFARGQKWPLDLDSCCARRGVARKSANIQKYWDAGLTFYEMPLEEVELYGRQDVTVLKELYYAQQELFKKPENSGLIPTIKMSNEFIWNLIDCERNGINIDQAALKEVEDEFRKEYSQLKADLERLAADAMGDTVVNLDSPEQLSWLIYSRKVNNKKLWHELFNLGTELRGSVMKPKRRPRMSSTEFIDAVRNHTSHVKRTRSYHCIDCEGRGLVYRKRRDGSNFKNLSKCGPCTGRGYRLVDQPEVAGFRLSPKSPEDIAAGGFKTDGDTIEHLLGRARKGTGAYEFLSRLSRYSAVGTYLDTFVDGIKRGIGEDGLLHTQLMQAITATGRLSSQQPNFQNLPRATTFPLRRVVTSRWEGGEIIEVDFAKLEYATAVFLAQDKVGMEDIQNGVDAHALTAEIIYDVVTKDTRQNAKPHTFKPLYGGSSGTDKEREYYQWFKDKHTGITAWQEKNKEQVLLTGKLVLPSGREYFFPGTKRLPNGWVTNTTQICNYPVQGFATGDIVPVGMIELRKKIIEASLRSLLILNVHDSYVFDIFPGEQKFILEIINDVFYKLAYILYKRFNMKLNVPLGHEVKAGSDWLNMKVIHIEDGKNAIRTFLG